jgi:hypothetical protein
LRLHSAVLAILGAACTGPIDPPPSLGNDDAAVSTGPAADAGGVTTADALVAVDAPPAPDAVPWPRYAYSRLEDPGRTVVTSLDGTWIATFTDGTYTVTLAGPERTFEEESAVSVTHGVWVRPLAAPFDGAVDEAWLDDALGAAKDPGRPDVLAVGMQYLAGAPPIYDAYGLQIAGDASYGPLDPATGDRLAGSDFNDYLGIPWTHPDGVDNPEPEQLGCMDCSGFIRTVLGFRLGVPMIKGSDGGGVSIPRRAVQMFASAPGLVTIPDTGAQVTAFERLAVGDLVFFDGDDDDGTDIDHVGIYLGIDADGHPRVLHSRRVIDGPSFGDTGGSSRLDGTGHYATCFRGARRI